MPFSSWRCASGARPTRSSSDWSSKGYQAYVLVPQPGKPPVYRVQVGRFKSRGDADRVASRLRQNEQFKPWVTR